MEADSKNHAAMIADISREVLNLYEELDRRILRFQGATGLKCPQGCGACCEFQEVEATVLEVLPLAIESFSARQEDVLYARIEEEERKEDRICILYQPDLRTPGNGKCAYYKVRPLLCRLFGFAARKNKEGNLELCTCKMLRATSSQELQEAGEKARSEFSLPVYQEISMLIAALNPGMGFRRLPLNLAIKSAIEEVYWKKIQETEYKETGERKNIFSGCH